LIVTDALCLNLERHDRTLPGLRKSPLIRPIIIISVCKKGDLVLI